MHSHDTFPTNHRFVFVKSPRKIALCWCRKEREGLLTLAAGHNGPCFTGLAQKGHAFADAQSVRETLFDGGQVLGQLF